MALLVPMPNKVVGCSGAFGVPTGKCHGITWGPFDLRAAPFASSSNFPIITLFRVAPLMAVLGYQVRLHPALVK